jgi:hypothetical protein
MSGVLKKGDLVRLSESVGHIYWYHQHLMRITSESRIYSSCYNVAVLKQNGKVLKYDVFNHTILVLDKGENRKRKIRKWLSKIKKR